MIKLVTISRISKEKGFERMRMLERMLHDAGVSFEWDCYGDTSTAYAKSIISKFRHIKFKGVTHCPTQVMRQYDYLVQLSDTEGFPYSIYEAMAQKVPVIATDFPSIHEMITDGVNGYILKMDLSNFNADKIQSIPVIKSFREKSTEKDWINFLDMTKKKTAQKGTAKTTSRQRAQGSTQEQKAATNPVSKQDVVNALNDKGNDQVSAAPDIKQGDDIVTHITGQHSDNKKPVEKTVAVKVTRRYHDTELGRVLEVGDAHEVTEKRAKELTKAKVADIVTD